MLTFSIKFIIMKKIIFIYLLISVSFVSFCQSDYFKSYVANFKEAVIGYEWKIVYEGYEDVNNYWGHGSGDFTIESYTDYRICFFVEDCPYHEPYLKLLVDGEELDIDYDRGSEGDIKFAMAGFYYEESIYGQFVGRLGSNDYYDTYLLILKEN